MVKMAAFGNKHGVGYGEFNDENVLFSTNWNSKHNHVSNIDADHNLDEDDSLPNNSDEGTKYEEFSDDEYEDLSELSYFSKSSIYVLHESNSESSYDVSDNFTFYTSDYDDFMEKKFNVLALTELSDSAFDGDISEHSTDLASIVFDSEDQELCPSHALSAANNDTALSAENYDAALSAENDNANFQDYENTSNNTNGQHNSGYNADDPMG
uniref:Uncharacterized protein n=1 Tax=Acrobeloides nanus TaxID=290746 RepID=A0A914CEK6_9BILA